MSAPRHTPGPWQIVDDVPSSAIGYRAILDAEGFIVANPSPMGDANARLIAAAPELLAALQDMAGAYQRHFDVMPVAWQTYDDIARAAIAKATGGAA